jgi:hypothetical protein
MSEDQRRPILVTGSHRSGTTWVGRALSCSPRVAYIDEPFSVLHRPGILRSAFPYWFPYLRPGERPDVHDDVARMLAFRYGYEAELRAVRSARDAGRLARDARRFRRWRAETARPLLKDPIALLSAPWLATGFGAQVVLLVRHPAAFASSLKRMGWTHPFGDFLQQPGLVDELVPELRPQIESEARRPSDVIGQAGLLWAVLHAVIDRYRVEHPEWIVLRHEDVSMQPEQQYRRLAARLDLQYAGAMDRFVRQTTLADGARDVPPGVAHRLERDSASNVWAWKARLTGDEIHRIRALTESVASGFYAESDW